ncbi:MAG: hypothetical protein JWM95_2177 [Gemmatimonadetes bacterium]|nr:hypothetical protein [Gemmatimonadota bacterium]
MSTPAIVAACIIVVVILAAGGIVWHILGQLVVGFARMEAGERIEENAPSPDPDGDRNAPPRARA